MKKQQLEQSLQRMRVELEKAQTLTVSVRQDLLSIVEDIESAIRNSDELHEEQGQPLRERLKDSVWRFEKSHPTLTMIVGQVMDDLGRMGI
jgi:ElaB/YqjD/DUF883 family membrane-anchored ribosome-binding protein